MRLGRAQRLGQIGTLYSRRMAEQTISEETELRAVIGSAADQVVAKIADQLNDLTRQFIDRSPFVCVATATPDGGLDVSPSGDPVEARLRA